MNPNPRGWTTAILTAAVAIVAVLVVPSAAQAQYFGRNKVQYESFDWKILKTAHFDIYYYPAMKTAVDDAARMAERWYSRYSKLFKHSFHERKPIIFYADQGDFQQTNAISGMIGEGTGGVTESLKNRVVLPFTGSYAETDHVLGHELVHAFQYDIADGAQSSSGGLSSQNSGLNTLPLWFIEGMAEYLSLGRYDPLTAMWLRDATERNDLPTLDELTTSFKYFPYRYGQAFWSFIAGRWGDLAIPRALSYSLRGGWEQGLRRVTGMTTDSLSKEWIAAIKSEYTPLMAGRTAPDSLGASLESEEDQLSLAPSVSPDGHYVAFLSTKDIFSIDLFLADANTGKVIDELLSADADPHIDALRFINSAGGWSPDGKYLAFVLYSEGNDELALINVADRSIERQIAVPGVGAITSPSYSPDGRSIVFSGSHGGISDLYVLDIASNRITRLTNDRYADLQPTFSPDGRTIAFVTDRGELTDFSRLQYARKSIGLMDVATRRITLISPLGNVKHANPQFSPDGANLFFVSNAGGWNDVYRYELASGKTFRVTHVKTGISGITELSPAMSVAAHEGRMLVSVFENGGYRIHTLMPPSEVGEPVSAGPPDSATAGVLPPPTTNGDQIVTNYLNSPEGGLGPVDTSRVSDYSWGSHISLDYLGTPTLGVAVDTYGASLGGGISAYFSDMLGNHQIGISAQINSDLTQIANTGLQLQYQNLANRWDWGIELTRIPYVTYYTGYGGTIDTVIDGQAQTLGYNDQYQETVSLNSASLMASYPLSQTLRLEANGGYSLIGYDLTRDRTYFDALGQGLGSTSTSLPSPDALNLFQGSLAYVGDNSYFGFTSPVRGSRYRIEGGGVVGDLRFATALLDYRRYFFFNPFTIAFRAMHYGRYGADSISLSRINPLFLGDPTYVRGYSSGSFSSDECSGPNCPEFYRLLGSRLAVANLEFRVPLFGTSDFGLINFPYLPTEISLFLDGGVAWTADDTPVLKFAETSDQRIPVFSAGISGRFNILGYLVLEVYYAYPFQRPTKGAHFGFQIAPGW